MAKRKKNRNTNRNNIPQHKTTVSTDNRMQDIYDTMYNKGTDVRGYEDALIKMEVTDDELEELLKITNNQKGNSTVSAMQIFMRELMNN